MNVWSGIGRLARDPSLKFTQSGKAVCSFTLAVDNPYKKDDASFISCVAWGKTAEILAEYSRKGDQLGATGRISVRTYDQDGDKKWVTEVVVDRIDFCGSKKKSETSEGAKKPTQSTGILPSDDDDEFPF